MIDFYLWNVEIFDKVCNRCLHNYNLFSFISFCIWRKGCNSQTQLTNFILNIARLSYKRKNLLEDMCLLYNDLIHGLLYQYVEYFRINATQISSVATHVGTDDMHILLKYPCQMLFDKYDAHGAPHNSYTSQINYWPYTRPYIFCIVDLVFEFFLVNIKIVPWL